MNLPPEIEQAYLAEAEAKGVSIDSLVQEALISAKPDLTNELSAEEWVKEFKDWVQSHADLDLPLLSDEAISRDAIYKDRGL